MKINDLIPIAKAKFQIVWNEGLYYADALFPDTSNNLVYFTDEKGIYRSFDWYDDYDVSENIIIVYDEPERIS